jgi:hypothetical protein
MEAMGGEDVVFGYDATDIAPAYLVRAHEGESGSEEFRRVGRRLSVAVQPPE